MHMSITHARTDIYTPVYAHVCTNVSARVYTVGIAPHLFFKKKWDAQLTVA